jgi:2-keto-4-pentenoate hydratase
MLNSDQIQSAADLLWTHWQDRRRLAELPDTLRPGSRGEGYRVQGMFEKHSKQPPIGWKIAATSKAGQAHIGVGGPLAGRLLAERAFRNGDTLQLGASHMKVVEPEFAFRMARDLPPRETLYTVKEVLDAVAALHPALEVPDSRYEDFTIVGAPQLIADNACAHEFVLGDPAPDLWRALDLAAHPVHARVTANGRARLERDGLGANVLGDPREALTWLVNELSGQGISLRANQVVTTGTCMVPLEIEAGDSVSADYGALGTVSLTFAASE